MIISLTRALFLIIILIIYVKRVTEKKKVALNELSEEQKEALKRFYAKHPSYMQEYFKKKADEMGVTLTDYHKYKRTDLYVRKSKEAKIPTKVYKKLYQQVSGRNRHEQIIKLWSITQEV